MVGVRVGVRVGVHPFATRGIEWVVCIGPHMLELHRIQRSEIASRGRGGWSDGRLPGFSGGKHVDRWVKDLIDSWRTASDRVLLAETEATRRSRAAGGRCPARRCFQ
jgi:hypothetical protein